MKKQGLDSHPKSDSAIPYSEGNHHAFIALCCAKSVNMVLDEDYLAEGCLYSLPGIPPGIPLESWNSTGLILEFDIPLDCGQNILGMLFYLLCLVSLCQVPLDSVKIL